jgi:hypothetical protein
MCVAKADMPGIGHAHCRIPDRGDFDAAHVFLQHGVETEKGEEDVRLDAFHAGAVAHDEPGINPVQRSLRDDDGNFFDFVGHGFSSYTQLTGLA